MTLVTIELVELPRKHQRMHFEVLIKGWIKLGHDAFPMRVNVIPLYAVAWQHRAFIFDGRRGNFHRRPSRAIRCGTIGIDPVLPIRIWVARRVVAEAKTKRNAGSAPHKALPGKN